jgi:hypothetical protein
MRRTIMLTPLLALALSVVLAACSGQTAQEASPAASPAPGPQTAAQVVDGLKAAGLPITKVTVYTAETDPNDLLGRPNGYTSKAAFSDGRLKGDDVRGVEEGSVTLGGGVEVFATEAEARKRMQYIQSVLEAMEMLGTEYDYVEGPVLLRLSQLLTPEQAKQYARALAE